MFKKLLKEAIYGKHLKGNLVLKENFSHKNLRPMEDCEGDYVRLQDCARWKEKCFKSHIGKVGMVLDISIKMEMVEKLC